MNIGLYNFSPDKSQEKNIAHILPAKPKDSPDIAPWRKSFSLLAEPLLRRGEMNLTQTVPVVTVLPKSPYALSRIVDITG